MTSKSGIKLNEVKSCKNEEKTYFLLGTQLGDANQILKFHVKAGNCHYKYNHPYF